MTNLDWLEEPSRATKRLLFARHGQYEGNLEDICNCDPRRPYPLTELGRQQALALANMLRGEGIEMIVCSEFQRARQTAAIVAGILQLPVLVNRLANENRVGPALEGKKTGLFQQSILADPANLANPGGESFNDMKARLSALIAQLLMSSPRTILVVTHGWPMQSVRVLQGEISDVDGARCRDMPGNCAVIDGMFNLAMLAPS
jgi:broad specificity phosphatase PhoE